MLLLARGSYPTPACFPPKTLVLRVVGVKGPQAYPAGSWERPDLGGELGGGVPRTAVSLASQPLALIRLIPWPLLFLAKLDVSVSCLPPSW